MRILALILAVSMAGVQQPVPAPNAGGVDILAELQTTLDARRARVGDPVRMRLLHALLAKGKVAVPEGATLAGHITEVARRTDANPESRLAIRIDRAEWKRHSVPFEAFIVRHARMVRRIVRGPVGARIGDSMEADMMQAMSGATRPQPPRITPPASSSTAPAQPTPPTPPAPSQPPAPAPTNPSSSTSPSQSGTTPAPQAVSSATVARDRVESRYAHETILASGPRAEDVTVRPSADPNIGSVLVSASREVVVPKGVLLVLKQSGKP